MSLDGGSALAIFPEGGNWTPHRWRRAIDRLRRGGRPDLAERAAAMPNVLPPHASGALAAIEACPAADVIFVAHTGLDRLVSVRDVWRGLRADMEVSARWWHVPAPSVPRAVTREAQLTWLYDWWQRIDAWITAENSGRGRPQAPTAGPPGRPVTAPQPGPLAKLAALRAATGDSASLGSGTAAEGTPEPTPAPVTAGPCHLGVGHPQEAGRPGRQPPVRPAEQGHHRRDEQAADAPRRPPGCPRRARWRGSSGRSARTSTSTRSRASGSRPRWSPAARSGRARSRRPSSRRRVAS